MENLTRQFQLQVIDSILEVLFINKDEAFVSLKEIQAKIPLRLSVSEIYRYTNKITMEGFVEEQSKGEYRITLEGIKLYHNGGYGTEVRQKRLKKFIKIGTGLLGMIGAVLSALYTLRQFFSH